MRLLCLDQIIIVSAFVGLNAGEATCLPDLPAQRQFWVSVIGALGKPGHGPEYDNRSCLSGNEYILGSSMRQ